MTTALWANRKVIWGFEPNDPSDQYLSSISIAFPPPPPPPPPNKVLLYRRLTPSNELSSLNLYSWVENIKNIKNPGGSLRAGHRANWLAVNETLIAINLPGCFRFLFLLSFTRKTKNAQLKNPTYPLHKNLMKPLRTWCTCNNSGQGSNLNGNDAVSSHWPFGWCTSCNRPTVTKTLRWLALKNYNMHVNRVGHMWLYIHECRSKEH